MIKSARANNSSSSSFSMPSRVAFSGLRYGSYPITRIFKPCARSATIVPILPQPIRPNVLPVISVPIKRDFSHLPALVDSLASGICRAKDSIKVMACSAVVTALPYGVFITITPRLVAAAISTLSTPIPARPTTFRFVAAFKISAVTLVAERIASPS